MISENQMLSQIITIWIVVILLALLVFFRAKVARLIIEFFTAKTHPVNLAVFRIMAFGLYLKWEPTEALLFSEFPKELLFVPEGLRWIIPYIPIDPSIVNLLVPLFKIFVFFAMVGFFSQFSAAMTALLAIYLFGIPQLYGKVTHYHHIIWFWMILAASPCGHALSIDALIKRWKNRKDKIYVPLQESIIYALPIRFIWLLIGYIYFSAGFWKWRVGGLDWIFSNNLIYRLYFKWIEFPGWTPSFRIDHYPLVCQFLALGVIVFEISFIFLIFFPRLRYVAIAAGLMFHQMTRFFMRIYSIDLYYSYIVFFDWYKIFWKLCNKFNLKWTTTVREISTHKNQQLNLRKHLIPTIIVGVILVVGNFYCGFKNIHSWPFSCYPTFANPFLIPYTSQLEAVLVTDGGREISFRDSTLGSQLPSYRFSGLMKAIFFTENPQLQKKRFNALWEYIKSKDPSADRFKAIRFYEKAIILIPEESFRNPIEKKLLFEIQVKN